VEGNSTMPPSCKHGSRFQKEKPGKREVQSSEEIAEKCKYGKVCPKNRKAIKVALDDFRGSPLVEAVGFGKADTGGSGVYLTVDHEKGEKIIKQLKMAKIVPANAKLLDFTPGAKTVRGGKSPWVLTLHQSKLHVDMTWNEALNFKGEIFTLVYIAEKTPRRPIKYEIFGRKKGDITRKDIPHIIELKTEGSWMTFPSIHYHQGSGARRTIISLHFVVDDEK